MQVRFVFTSKARYQFKWNIKPQGHVQVLLNILRGYNVQESLDAPRFCISAGPPDAEVKESEQKAGDINSEVYFEEGISDETIMTLRSL